MSYNFSFLFCTSSGTEFRNLDLKCIHYRASHSLTNILLSNIFLGNTAPNKGKYSKQSQNINKAPSRPFPVFGRPPVLPPAPWECCASTLPPGWGTFKATLLSFLLMAGAWSLWLEERPNEPDLQGEASDLFGLGHIELQG